MVGGYTENLEKPQNCQNWGVAACQGQYGTVPIMYTLCMFCPLSHEVCSHLHMLLKY